MVDIEKMPVGAKEARLLSSIRELGSPGIKMQDARRLFPDEDPKTVHYTLKRLTNKGLLRRLAAGKYYLPDADPTRAACHAWAPAYESFLTVLAQAGATEQIPRRLDLAYAQTRTRRAHWGQLPVTWHPLPPDAFQGYDLRADGALVATPAKAAADLVHRQAAFGGLSPYRTMVRAALRGSKPRPLAEALGAYESQPGTLRRLLWLTYGEDLPASWRMRIGRLDTHNPLPLDLVLRGTVRPAGRGTLNIIDPPGGA